MSAQKTIEENSNRSLEFDPKILCIACNWCTYAGADLAGTSRIQYPTNVRILRVMCTGRVHPTFVLKAFKMGVDGVLISGCHYGDCHYQVGNKKAERIVLLLQKVLKELGIEPQRLRFETISASEGIKFADVVTEMVDELKKLGPNPLISIGEAD